VYAKIKNNIGILTPSEKYWCSYIMERTKLRLHNTFLWRHTIVRTVDYFEESTVYSFVLEYKGNNKITEHRAIFQRESQNS